MVVIRGCRRKHGKSEPSISKAKDLSENFPPCLEGFWSETGGALCLQFIQPNHRVQSELLIGLRLALRQWPPLSVSLFSRALFPSHLHWGWWEEKMWLGEEVLRNLQNTQDFYRLKYTFCFQNKTRSWKNRPLNSIFFMTILWYA